MRYPRMIPIAAALAALASTAAAQEPAIKEATPGLLAQAKITPDAARAAALRAVPGATVKEAEIEREHRKLVYSFDLNVPGKNGIQEVLVNAKTGKVISSQHETQADEAREAAQDGKADGKRADHDTTKP